VHIFISYSRLDTEIAARLVVALRRAGLEVWRDDVIQGGAEWRGEIVHALQQCRVFLLLYSRHSEGSAEVAKEVAAASALRIPIIPLRIEARKPVGALLYEMARLSWIDAVPPSDVRLEEVALAFSELMRDSMTTRARDRFATELKAYRVTAGLIHRLTASNVALCTMLACNTASLAVLFNHATGFLQAQAQAGMPLMGSLWMLVETCTVGVPVLAAAGFSKLWNFSWVGIILMSLVNMAISALVLRNAWRVYWVKWRAARDRTRLVSMP
jgi:TIR domain